MFFWGNFKSGLFLPKKKLNNFYVNFDYYGVLC